jgi:hypothetical protein
VSNAWAICPQVRNSLPKGGVIPDVIPWRMLGRSKAGIRKDLSLEDEPMSYQLVGEVTAHQGLRVAGLRGWSATLGLRHCPDSYGRLQSRILDNVRKHDPATPRAG